MRIQEGEAKTSRRCWKPIWTVGIESRLSLPVMSYSITSWPQDGKMPLKSRHEISSQSTHSPDAVQATGEDWWASELRSRRKHGLSTNIHPETWLLFMTKTAPTLYREETSKTQDSLITSERVTLNCNVWTTQAVDSCITVRAHCPPEDWWWLSHTQNAKVVNIRLFSVGWEWKQFGLSGACSIYDGI